MLLTWRGSAAGGNENVDSTGSPRRINEAVQRALSLCRHSVAPIVSLAQIMDELRTDQTWTADDVQQVESALRRVLARLVERESAAANRRERQRESGPPLTNLLARDEYR